MAVVLAVYNRKGGVGKTSSVVNIGGCLAEKKKKVLLIDGDSQINMTQFFFDGEGDICEGEALQEGIPTVLDLLEGNAQFEDVVRTKSFESRRRQENKYKTVRISLDILPGTKELDYYSADDEEAMRRIVDSVSDRYDYILIDFPPAHNRVTMMNLNASDYVIVPLQLAGDDSVNGYIEVIGRCREIREDYSNKKLQVLGTFYNVCRFRYNDQKMLYDQSMQKEIRKSLSLFKTPVREDYATSQTDRSLGSPACMTSWKSKLAEDYRDLTDEIVKRIKKMNKKGAN